ncbi:uncharacterized protein LOC124281311 [Haliotis rubra]|uniref:uncharacterized protein LOC124281311 n=1 Tax=Haliotis rubra TaxID=36100 RepID=UPI001EE51317|nr:uncharacterized protein LOC124281311 [Haliotis rubra]
MRIYRRRNERYARQCVREVDRHGGEGVMMWAGISVNDRTELVHVQGNLNAVRYRDEILALSGPCFMMSCPVTTRCQVDRHGRATCVPEFPGCGHPPDVPGTSMTYDGHYQGAVVRYTCKEDFTVCHQRNTSVCQASGQWETVANICGKFRWRNPKVNQEYDLPCGPQSNFSVYLLATPTTDKR